MNNSVRNGPGGWSTILSIINRHKYNQLHKYNATLYSKKWPVIYILFLLHPFYGNNLCALGAPASDSFRSSNSSHSQASARYQIPNTKFSFTVLCIQTCSAAAKRCLQSDRLTLCLEHACLNRMIPSGCVKIWKNAFPNGLRLCLHHVSWSITDLSDSSGSR